MENRKPRLYLIDDDVLHSRALGDILCARGFQVTRFSSAADFLSYPNVHEECDLIISDINMPGTSGFDLCREIRRRPAAVRMPIILITGSDALEEKAKGLDAGADDFIGKIAPSRELIAKISSLLEIRKQDLKNRQELESSKAINTKLQGFLSPNIASRIAEDEAQAFLRPHRAEVTVLFVDIRRFTAFSERVEPEEVMAVLSHYYRAVGTAAIKYNGTLGHLAGDGIMVFFNDPEPVENHMEMAVRMAVDARNELLEQKKNWDDRNYDIDFGIGLSQGFATIGGIGFDLFSQYSVIGPVANFASRLCHLATDGQILISHRFFARLNLQGCQAAELGNMPIKGIDQAVRVFNVMDVEAANKKAG